MGGCAAATRSNIGLAVSSSPTQHCAGRQFSHEMDFTAGLPALAGTGFQLQPGATWNDVAELYAISLVKVLPAVSFSLTA